MKEKSAQKHFLIILNNTLLPSSNPSFFSLLEVAERIKCEEEMSNPPAGSCNTPHFISKNFLLIV